MGAIVVTMLVALFAISLVAGLVVLSALAVAGAKAATLAHDGSNWLVEHWPRRARP
ncbi:hypothetical protein J2S53_002568 [Actinopolyspora lacussalsi]|uniref:Uncharacterized protein n=3 Tax=Actinopolyspora TaxID=1849 RepID=A0A1G8WH15_ACTMZ|nr:MULTISPECIES: hypothetical protein [Actinopolyspora alba group]MDP9642623.1 hypothetical protein [Actinopolyspora lacussalsi]SDJ77608.1 hypothetical protein SAMN04487820_10240 [Actinopolyspora mzabensis]SFD90849.1 hypothetical protein SAMN04487819_10530 [Actinopolyspora alba]SFT58410.1 hypothetical protein SAMN04487904_10428 [Actinopolyspora righensis]